MIAMEYGDSFLVQRVNHLAELSARNSTPKDLAAALFEAVHIIEQLRKAAAPPPNEPLTLEQLREMDGEPVWCVDGYGNACWCLVNCDDGLPCCYDNETGLWDGSFYEMSGDGKYGLHKTGWLAYRRRPEEVNPHD